jgi:signal transduction histidine kinase/CheY-like chemotaxis protein
MSNDASPFSLSRAPPGLRDRGIAAAVIVIFVVTFCLSAPFARTALPRIDAFIPAYEAALAINDFITAVLLFALFSRERANAYLVLACGYLFDALIIIPHALTFPGVFSATGLLGASSQATVWLYCFWHGGFALFVLAYSLLINRDDPSRLLRRSSGLAIAIGAALTMAAVVALTVLVTAGHDLLTPVVNGGDYSMLVTKGISPAIFALSIAALILLWRRRNMSTLDLWLFVIMCAWLCDVSLSSIVGSSRFDLGWYGGRIYGLLAASLLLVVLLFELNKLYDRLGDALAVAEARNVELADSREQLAHAQRLEAMGQLTGGVAHDFNNLLMIMTGSLDFILRSSGNAAKVERLARAGLEAAAKGQKLTQQLLTFARKQVSKPVTVNPNHLISDFEPLLRSAIGADIEIVTRLSPILDPTSIDPAQFEAAILNLFVNARDAMSGGGRITIETQNVAVGNQAPEQDGLAPGNYVLVSVSDTGSGMTAETIEKAFDPFFTTKEVGRGSGLGLSQVYGFSKSTGGQVNISSALGTGTVVKLYLPRSSDPVRADAVRAVLPFRSARGEETILAVEDDSSLLELVVSGLEELGYRVVTATNAAEAMAVLRADMEIDVLFSDVIMPGGMNGAQLAVEARRIRPGLKVLLTSGYTAEALVQEHGLPQDLEVLDKPYRYEDLASKLRSVIAR